MTDETQPAAPEAAPELTPAAPAAETFYNGETEEQLAARGLTKTGSLLNRSEAKT